MVVIDLGGHLSSVAPFIAWATLPQFGTSLLLQGVYNVLPALRPQTPHTAQVHHNRARAVIIAAYLAYTLYSSVAAGGPSFYEILDVPLDVDADEVPRRFRKLARLHHPDKVGPRGEAFFISLREASDVLGDDVKRGAYERFGPSIVHWRDVITEREYMGVGLRESIPYYVINAAVFAFINWMNGEAATGFWRLTLFLVLFSFEAALLLNPTRLLPIPRFQQIAFLHQLFISLTLAGRQLFPLLPHLGLVPALGTKFGHRSEQETRNDLEELREAVVNLQRVAYATKLEATRAVGEELAPFRPAERPSAATLRQAAEAACAARGQPKPPADAIIIREPSAGEQAWMSAFTEELVRRRTLLDAIAQQQQRPQQQLPAAGAIVGLDGKALPMPPTQATHTQAQKQPATGAPQEAR